MELLEQVIALEGLSCFLAEADAKVIALRMIYKDPGEIPLDSVHDYINFKIATDRIGFQSIMENSCGEYSFGNNEFGDEIFGDNIEFHQYSLAGRYSHIEVIALYREQ